MTNVRKRVDFPVGLDATITIKGEKLATKVYKHIPDKKDVELAKAYDRAVAGGTLENFKGTADYAIAVKNGWIDKIFETGKDVMLTADQATERAKAFPSRSTFRAGDPTAFLAASMLGLMDELFPRAAGRFSLEQVQAEALKHPNSTTFRLRSFPHYNTAMKRGWLDQLTYTPSVRARWDKAGCAEVAKDYATRSSFASGNQYAYNMARREGWLDEFYPPNGSHSWTREATFEFLKRDGVRGLLAYNAKWMTHAATVGWVDEFFRQ